MAAYYEIFYYNMYGNFAKAWLIVMALLCKVIEILLLTF